MLDRYAISRDKQFCIVEIAGKIYIIGISNHTMTLLDTLDAEVFAELTENDDEPVPWNMTPVGQYGNKLTQKLVAFVAEKTGKAGQKSKENEKNETSEETKTSEEQKTSEEREKTEKANFSENLKEAELKSSEDQPKAQKKKKPSDNNLKNSEEGE